MIAPFFTTYLIRTIAWKTILSDESPVVSVLQTLALVPQDGRVLATAGAVIAGLTYNFLPFMILPIYASLERLDMRADRGGQGPLRLAAQAFLQGDAAAHGAGDRRRRRCSPSSPPSATTSTPSFLGGTEQAMIGNVIQSLYLNQRDYPAAAALSFVLMALILVDRPRSTSASPAPRPDGRRGGGGLMSGARPRRWAGCASTRCSIVAALVVALHADPDRRHLRLLLQRPDRPLQLHLGRLHHSSTGTTPSRIPELNEALLTSLKLAALATVISTAIGTLMALALVRHQFLGRRAANFLIVIPMATPGGRDRRLAALVVL